MLNANSSKAMGYICLIDIMHSHTMNKVTQVMDCASAIFNQSVSRVDYGLVMVWGTDAK